MTLKLVEPTPKGTKYEQLEAQKAKYTEVKAHVEEAIADIEAELDRAILDNRSTDDLYCKRQEMVESRRRAELFVQDLDRQIAMAEPDHLRARIAEIDQRRATLGREGAEQADKYNAMRKEFREFEAQYKGDADERGRELDRLSDQRHSLEWRLSDLEAQHEAAN